MPESAPEPARATAGRGATAPSGALPAGVRLERLRVDHAPALLAFEVENRAYFASHISDRGDDYFTEFAARHAELLADQDAGEIQFHLLVDDDGRVLGRVNLMDLADGSAELGYRIAEHATGRGLATAGVFAVCELAVREYGLQELRAGTNLTNAASQAVLVRTGFVPIGEATYGGQPGLTYRRSLTV